MKRLNLVFGVLLLAGCTTGPAPAMTVAGYKARAEAAVDAVTVQDVRGADRQAMLIVDVRELDELQATGIIGGAVHVPRGVLEFYADPASSMYVQEFGSARRIVFVCETGGRSLLAAATAAEMGMTGVTYLEGGVRAWQSAGGELVPYSKP